MKKFLLPTLLLLTLGCTENIRAKTWGGTMTLSLPCGQKLFDVTWKTADFWYATRPMRADEEPETYEFRENSNFGMVEGKVLIRECR